MAKKIVNSISIGNTELQFRSLVPSNYSINVTPNGHGSHYTAPADGWYVMECYLHDSNPSASLTHTFGLMNHTTGLESTALPPVTTSGATWNSTSLAVKKGDDVQIWYYDQTVKSFKFIYALGSEPEENSSNE